MSVPGSWLSLYAFFTKSPIRLYGGLQKHRHPPPFLSQSVLLGCEVSLALVVFFRRADVEIEAELCVELVENLGGCRPLVAVACK